MESESVQPTTQYETKARTKQSMERLRILQKSNTPSTKENSEKNNISSIIT